MHRFPRLPSSLLLHGVRHIYRSCKDSLLAVEAGLCSFQARFPGDISLPKWPSRCSIFIHYTSFLYSLSVHCSCFFIFLSRYWVVPLLTFCELKKTLQEQASIPRVLYNTPKPINNGRRSQGSLKW
jgi:hypothetical protein